MLNLLLANRKNSMGLWRPTLATHLLESAREAEVPKKQVTCPESLPGFSGNNFSTTVTCPFPLWCSAYNSLFFWRVHIPRMYGQQLILIHQNSGFMTAISPNLILMNKCVCVCIILCQANFHTVTKSRTEVDISEIYHMKLFLDALHQ